MKQYRVTIGVTTEGTELQDAETFLKSLGLTTFVMPHSNGLESCKEVKVKQLVPVSVWRVINHWMKNK